MKKDKQQGAETNREASEAVDAYIAERPPEVRPTLQAIRSTIRAAAPDAVERFAWGMPTYWQGRNIMHFAAFKHHIGLYPGSEAVEAFSDRLVGYKTSKGTIRFPLDGEVDQRLIADLVRWNISRLGLGEE